jgi:hypothetical protein
LLFKSAVKIRKGTIEGKSGQALQMAVSEGFGGGVLSLLKKQAAALSGERGCCELKRSKSINK